MSKRGNGEGSIYFSEKLNRWVSQCYINDKRRSFYGKTRKEANKKMQEAKSDEISGTFIDKNDITISDLGINIIEKKHNANIIGDNTYQKNLCTFKVIDTHLGKITLQEITDTQIQNFFNMNTNYSNSVIKRFYEMLNMIFKEAIKRNFIAKNPMDLVIKPKSNKQDKKIDALTIEEQKKFVKYVNNDLYKNVFLIALHTGMRIGEILALTITDIDFQQMQIHICNTLTRDVNGKVVLGNKTKTDESIRIIPITIILKPILEDSIANYIPNKNNLLFIQPNGNLVAPTLINTRFKKICKYANIRKYKKPTPRIKNGIIKIYNESTSNVNTHMLRHTYATRCIEAGVPAEVLQKLLGHKDISITINTYTTIFDKYKKESLDNYINYINNI